MKTQLRYTIIILILTVLLLFVSCGGSAVLSGTASGASAGGTENNGGTTIVGVNTNQNWGTVYAPILQGYRDAVMNGFKDYPNDKYNPSDLVPYGFREYYGLGGRFVYYAYKDIDGNGVPELLIGLNYIMSNPQDISPSIEDIWTVTNTGLVRVFGSPGDSLVIIYPKGTIQWTIYNSDNSDLTWLLSIGSSGGAVANAVERETGGGAPEWYEPPAPHLLWSEVQAMAPEKAYKDISVVQNKVSNDEINNKFHIDSLADADISWLPLFTQSDQRDVKDLKTSSDGIVQPDVKVNAGDPVQVVPKDGVNLRKGPGADYDIITAIPYNKDVEEIGFNRDNYDWVYVRYNDHEGWVANEFVQYGSSGGGSDLGQKTESSSQNLSVDQVKMIYRDLAQKGNVVDNEYAGYMNPNDDIITVNGNKYCYDSAYKSIADLKAATETVYTKSYAEQNIYKHAFNGQPPQYVDQNGKLYKLDVGGWGGEGSAYLNTITITSQTSDTITFTAVTSAEVTDVTFMNSYRLKKIDDSWRLDCPVYGEQGKQLTG